MAIETIDKYIEEIEEMINEAPNLPLTSGRRMVDPDKVFNLLDSIRLNIPQEIKDAKAVVAERASIIEEANREAEEIIRKAENRARQIVSEQEIVKNAKATADALLSQTNQKVKLMEQASLEFSENALKKSEDALLLVFNEVKNTRLALRGKIKK